MYLFLCFAADLSLLLGLLPVTRIVSVYLAKLLSTRARFGLSL